MQSFSSLAALIDAQKPKSLLVDLWGVIHDGEALYPGVVDGLGYLKQKKVSVIFLSNAPRRASVAEANLKRLGIARDLYTGIITSGEATFDYLSASSPWGKNYIYIGPEKDRTLLDGLPYTEVTQAKEASFAICTGFDHDDSTLAEKMPALTAAYIAKLPLVCSNPDMEIVRLSGKRPLCAGVMALWYEEQGGNAYYFGKPYKNIYDLAIKTYNLEPQTTLAIGDNLDTDIKGANNYGVRSVLVTGGVLNQELQSGKKLEDICQANGNIPSFTIASFR
jgi:HAD superfamily hydrolase (TIGR01459 family)